jgi:hypothetical protein
MNWERLWRSSGVGFVVLIVIASVIYGRGPERGASADSLAAFYQSHHTRILVAAVISGFAVLNLMWFAAAITSVLRAAGESGWGTAVTVASAAFGGVFFAMVGLSAGLAYTFSSGNRIFAADLHRVIAGMVVMSAFPRAMLTMAPTFGLWRAKLISNGLFNVGVVAVILTLLGGLAWAGTGFWAPDGAYARWIAPIIGAVWALVLSGVVLKIGHPEEHALEPGPSERVQPMEPATPW